MSKNIFNIFGSWQKERESGFTIIEVLIAVFVVGTTMVGLFGLFVLSLRLAQQGEQRVVAIGLANERAEMIRNLPYSDVGTSGGIPSGSISQSEVITRNGVPFTVETDIQYVDDDYDGLAGGGGGGGCIAVSHIPAGNPGNCQDLCVGASSVNAHIAHGDSASFYCNGDPITGPDVLNTDYKQARIEVSWPSINNLTPILLLMVVAPDGIEGGDIFGTLDFLALDALGQPVEAATMRLINNSVSPVVDITTLTNSEGRVILPGLPTANQTYELALDKTGYTSEQTYDSSATFFPDVEHTHLSALIGQITSKTFFIDLVARFDLLTTEPRNPASLNYGQSGDTDSLEITHDATYELSDGTVSLWFKARDVTDPRRGIWSKDANGYDNGGHVTIQTLTNQLNVRHQTDSADNTVVYDGLQENHWYHVAYSFGAGGMKLYVDGVEVDSDGGATQGMDLNLEPIAIGAGTWNSAIGSIHPLEGAFDGLIDEVRIFDSGLALGDVQTLANGDDYSVGMIGRWAMDESAGPSTQDSVIGNDGQWNGGVSRSFDTPYIGGAGSLIGALDYLLLGTKTIGTDNLSQPVYKVDSASTSDANGEASHDDLEWDSYSLTVDGATTGYDIRASSHLLPVTLNPADDIDIEMYLVDHTPISLLAIVIDGNGLPIDNAVVQLTDNGHDETLTTGPLGQVLFADLPSNDDYTIDVSAVGLTSQNTIVTVLDTSTIQVQLVP